MTKNEVAGAVKNEIWMNVFPPLPFLKGGGRLYIASGIRGRLDFGNCGFEKKAAACTAEK